MCCLRLLFLLLLFVCDTFANDCQVGSWSVCSSSCGRGTRTRNITQNKNGAGQDCPSLSEECANTNCGQIDMTAIGAVADHGPLATWRNSRNGAQLPASLAIDGITNTRCAATLASKTPWLRVDLKTAYLITSVETSFFRDRGNGAVVRIGSDLTNDGNDNPLCGTVPDRNNQNDIWTATIVCSPSLWGWYINVQNKLTSTDFLSVCELKASYALDVAILYNNSSVASGSFFVYEGDPLPFPALCVINVDSINFNSLLNIHWNSSNSQIPDSLSNPDVGQSRVNNFAILRIRKAPRLDTSYTCQFTWTDNTQKTLQFDLNINVDCSWSAWSMCLDSCGVGTRSRTADSSVIKHQGKNCTGPSSEECDTGQAPCPPTPINNLRRVEEGQTASLECEATQFRLIQTPITFEWFKNGVQIVNPSNSSTRSLGNGKYKGILTLSAVKGKDAGSSYTCKANGNDGLSNASAVITLDVTEYAPFDVKVIANTSTFVVEQPLTLNCSAVAKPPPSQYKWHRDGKRIEGETGQQLSFPALNVTNAGIYNCTAINDRGATTSDDFEMVIDGPPKNCSSLSGASVVGDSIELSVSGCSINGNAAVTKYKVLYRVLGSSNDWSQVDGTSLPINIADLIPFTKYEVKVAAGNLHGYGPYSTSMTFTTAEGKPGPPRNATVRSTGSSSVEVAWLRPLQTFGNIDHYYIYYQESSLASSRKREINEKVKIVSGSGTRANLTDLLPRTKYTIEVAGVNIRQSDKELLIGNRSKKVEGQTEESLPLSGKSDPNLIIIIVAVVVIILLIIIGIILAIVILRRRRRSNGKNMYEATSMAAVAKNGEILDTSSDIAPEVVIENLSLIIYEGTTALLPCDVTGSPPPTIQWYKDDKKVPGRNSRFHQLPNGSLQIAAVCSKDEGSYRCVATNGAGSDEQTVELTVKPSDSEEKPTKQSGEVQGGMHSINLDDFPDHVTALHELNNAGFSEEFKTLGSISSGVKFSTEAASANLPKNRYKNILTYDHARVPLKSVPGMGKLESDYIAAAYVDGHSKPNKYIASQGPRKDTCSDMWRMIWGEDVRTIVMLTHLVEKNKIKCHQYWPENVGSNDVYDGLSVTLDSIDKFAEYDIKKIAVRLGEETRRIKLYHFTSWPDHGVPKFSTGLLTFIRRINREYSNEHGPMIVHCSAGVGRTGTFIIIDQMLEKIEESLPLDVFNAVASLRTRRQDMVQGEAQYIFIHNSLLEATLCGNTQIAVQNLRNAWSRLSKKDKRNRTGFDRQFLVLETTSPRFDKSVCKAGLQSGVRKKNRYSEIVPLDTERVVLRLEEEGNDAYVNTAAGSNYINASFLNGYRRRDEFIVTQGPLKNTVNDFWKMIWEQGSLTIVNLTQLEENGEEMCYHYWPASESATYGPYTVNVEQTTPCGDYTIRKMLLSKGSESRSISQFHFTEWPEDQCPKKATQVLDMLTQMVKWQQSTGNNVITVHCNNGIGRSGVFCTLVSVLDCMKVESVIDVFYKVKLFRIKRPGIVQTVDQYRFCYQAIVDYTEGFETYSNFK